MTWWQWLIFLSLVPLGAFIKEAVYQFRYHRKMPHEWIANDIRNARRKKYRKRYHTTQQKQPRK